MEQLVSASVLARVWQLSCGTFFIFLFAGDDALQGFSATDTVVQGRRGGVTCDAVNAKMVLSVVSCCTLSSERRRPD